MAGTIVVGGIKKDEAATPVSIDGIAVSWVNFDTHGSDSVRDSLNVSSMTDLGTGLHRQSFINSMSNTHYSFNVGGGNGRVSGNNTYQGGPTGSADGAPATASLGFSTNIHSGVVADPKDGTGQIWGDLA